MLADYEQSAIIQHRVYDDPKRPLLKTAMRLNQGIADSSLAEDARKFVPVQKPELPISAECGQGTPVPFPGDITVAQDRVSYYDRLVAEYLNRAPLERAQMARVIRGRDPLTGGGDYARGRP